MRFANEVSDLSERELDIHPLARIGVYSKKHMDGSDVCRHTIHLSKRDIDNLIIDDYEEQKVEYPCVDDHELRLLKKK